MTGRKSAERINEEQDHADHRVTHKAERNPQGSANKSAKSGVRPSGPSPSVFKERTTGRLRGLCHKRWPTSSSICVATPNALNGARQEEHHDICLQQGKSRSCTLPDSIARRFQHQPRPGDTDRLRVTHRTFSPCHGEPWPMPRRSHEQHCEMGGRAAVKADRRMMTTASCAPWWRGRPEANTSKTRSSSARDSHVHVTQSDNCT